MEANVTDISVPLPIRTPRLTLRLIHETHAAALLTYKQESWDDLLKWLIWVHPPSIEIRTLEDEKLFCQAKHDDFLKRKNIVLLAFQHGSDKLIGTAGLHNCIWDQPREFSLGFTVRSTETGKGYATEMAQSLIKYGFEALQADQITTMHADGNTGSQKVIEKCGFHHTETKKDIHELPDKVVDEHHYKICRNDKYPDIAVNWL